MRIKGKKSFLRPVGIIVTATILALLASFVFYAKSRYQVPILMYHSIDPKPMFKKLNVPPDIFKKQMLFLKRHKYNVISMEEFLDLMELDKKAPPRSVVITIDDGYKNNFTYAYPILKELGFNATIFVIVNFVGNRGFMTWDDLKKISHDNITIGSHTMTHPDLTTLPPEKIRYELMESKKILGHMLNKKIALFCYPLGRFDDTVRALVVEAGYRGGCTTKVKRFKRHPDDDIYALRRVKISGSNSMFVFWTKISGYYNIFRRR